MTRDDAHPGETLLAIQNALKLGASLMFTWGIALAMRFWLPRHLGPSRFGTLSFADAFAAMFFIALTLGVDPYIRKEVSVRPAHASDFFGGTFVLRIGLSFLIMAIMAVVMRVMGTAPDVQRIVFIFAVAQFFVTANATLSALLHAQGSVDGMSMLAIATKIIWALGVVLAVMTGIGLVGVALSFLLSEAIETVVLYGLANKHLKLEFRVDRSATKAVIISSLPHYLNLFAITAYGKLDLTFLTLFATTREVGWYAAASSIAGFALLVTPLIGWVLMPTLARAAARSHEELLTRVRRSTELILSIAIPASLFVCLASDLGIKLLFGEAFAPAGLALRILAPTFVVTYVAIVFAITLIMLERAWTLVAISCAGLVVNIGLNLMLIPIMLPRLGDGGGGAGCALAMLGTEIFVTSAMASVVGRGAIDRQTLSMAAKSLAACALVLVVDRLSMRLGWARLALDAVVYAMVVIATGALRPGEIMGVVREAMRARKAGGAIAPEAAE